MLEALEKLEIHFYRLQPFTTPKHTPIYPLPDRLQDSFLHSQTYSDLSRLAPMNILMLSLCVISRELSSHNSDLNSATPSQFRSNFIILALLDTNSTRKVKKKFFSFINV
ncbi:hypothetical protein TNCV_3671221 [Trichonephila clavipes]|nr:hypothetical protein TNCV_3671221 [Trichonephila clavipes]